MSSKNWLSTTQIKFVQSVCDGLCYGFWPWAEFPDDGSFPTTWDESRPCKDSPESDFLESQRDKEIEAGQFSALFGPDLLPGMYSMPIHAVPKPDGLDLRMVMDHSTGRYALNSVIPHSSIVGTPLDNSKHFGSSLLNFRKIHGNSAKLILFKSDVKGAHCLMPVCFEWQIKQINTIKGCRHVGHCACFGDSGPARIWSSFFSLVLWIARFVKFIEDLFAYADDFFSVELQQNMLLYPPYKKLLPQKQTQLLLLFNKLGIPHKERKQVSGSTLKIIGFEVDIDCMSFTMPADSKLALISFICDFLTQLQASLKDFQHLAGWVNWALNVFPLLCPSLSNIYAKCSSKPGITSHSLLALNNSIRPDLQWLLFHIEHLNGIHLLQSISWPVADTNTTIFHDACPSGLGFWYPKLNLGFFCPANFPIPSSLLYFTVPHLSLQTPCVRRESAWSPHGVRTESA
jgi:hypothetical protein